MQVRDIMSSDLIAVGPDDAISQALGKMKKARINQLLVMQNGELYGILELRKIVTKDINPANAKVANFVEHTTTIDASASVESAASVLLKSGTRAMPVADRGEIVGVVSESDIIKDAAKYVKPEMKASEIVSPALFVETGAPVGKVQKMMVEKNISRVPVVDKGEVQGLVSTLELIKLLEGKERMDARGGRLNEPGATEKLKIEDAPVESFMRPAAISKNRPIVDIIELLKKNEEVIIKDGETFGVITPKDILELFPSGRDQLYVQITGMQHESIEFKIKMDESVSKFVQKMAKTDTIQFLFFHVNKIEKGGKRDFYDIRARFKMPKGFFVAKAEGWQPVNAIQDVISKLESEVAKKYGKMDTKARKQKMRHF